MGRSGPQLASLLGPTRLIGLSPPTQSSDKVGFSLPKKERKKERGEKRFLGPFLMNSQETNLRVD